MLFITRGVYEGIQIQLVDHYKELFIAALSMNSTAPDVIDSSARWVDENLLIETPDVLPINIPEEVDALLASLSAGVLDPVTVQSRLTELFRLQEIVIDPNAPVPVPSEPTGMEPEV